jgi:hypothetical protein
MDQVVSLGKMVVQHSIPSFIKKCLHLWNFMDIHPLSIPSHLKGKVISSELFVFSFIIHTHLICLIFKKNGILYPLFLVFDYSILGDNTIIFDIYILQMEFKLLKYLLVNFSNIVLFLFFNLKHDPIYQMFMSLFNSGLHF